MKSIQKLSVAFIAGIILSSGIIMAQRGPGRGNGLGMGPLPEDRQERMLDRLAYELKLTDEQKEKVNEIYGKHFEEMKTLREEEQKQIEAMRKKHDEKRAEVNDDVKKELTAEQQAKFDELLDRVEVRRDDFRRGDGRGFRDGRGYRDGRNCPRGRF